MPEELNCTAQQYMRNRQQNMKKNTSHYLCLSKNCLLCLNTSQKLKRQKINHVLLFQFSVWLASVLTICCKIYIKPTGKASKVDEFLRSKDILPAM